MSLVPFFQGIFLGLSMIVPIGAQNSFVLKQGMTKKNHFTVAFICAFCDIALIAAGIYGVGKFISGNTLLMTAISIAGFLFLSLYGGLSLKQALRPQHEANKESEIISSRRKTIMVALAVTLLNPHAYLDTVVILGGLGSQYPDIERDYFAAGTMLASVLWFYLLAFSASKMAAWLNLPRVKRAIDGTVALIMFYLAIKVLSAVF